MDQFEWDLADRMLKRFTHIAEALDRISTALERMRNEDDTRDTQEPQGDGRQE